MTEVHILRQLFGEPPKFRTGRYTYHFYICAAVDNIPVISLFRHVTCCFFVTSSKYAMFEKMWFAAVAQLLIIKLYLGSRFQ
jgi:hypothetical protein